MTSRLRPSRGVMQMLLVLATAACGGGGDGIVSRPTPEPPPAAVTAVAVTPSSATARVGQPVTLTAAVTATGGASIDVSWSSDNATVATVPEAGGSTVSVTTLAPGTATIRARSRVSSSVVGSAVITVQPRPEAIAALTLSPSQPFSLAEQTVTDISATATGLEPGATVTFSFSSSNPAIATVAPVGITGGARVTAVAPGGPVQITATATGSGSLLTTVSRTASVAVTVTSVPAALTSVSLSPSSGSVAVGQALGLTPSPTLAGSGVIVTYIFTTSSPAIVSVNASTGTVTGVAPGTATITVTATGTGAGFTTSTRTATANVTVTLPLEALTAVSVSGGTVMVGQALTLTPTPTRASPAVSVVYAYNSSAPSIASVNASTGVVTGVAPGSATITVTATGSGPGFTTSQRTATANVSVTAATPPLGQGYGAEQFAAIPAGAYNRGSTMFNDEQPVRSVTISAFQMQRTEVTQAQWRQVMSGTAQANPSFYSGCDACPVEQVSWEDVQLFLTRLNAAFPGLGYRLPTEAEWEYAARATTTGDYGVAGRTVAEQAWINTNSSGRTQPVAVKLANLFGLYDMHGNVFEWAQDWYDEAYYATSPLTNPQGPTLQGTFRVVRGGSWGYFASFARSSSRLGATPNFRGTAFGFRVARNP